MRAHCAGVSALPVGARLQRRSEARQLDDELSQREQRSAAGAQRCIRLPPQSVHGDISGRSIPVSFAVKRRSRSDGRDLSRSKVELHRVAASSRSRPRRSTQRHKGSLLKSHHHVCHRLDMLLLLEASRAGCGRDAAADAPAKFASAAHHHRAQPCFYSPRGRTCDSMFSEHGDSSSISNWRCPTAVNADQPAASQRLMGKTAHATDSISKIYSYYSARARHAGTRWALPDLLCFGYQQWNGPPDEYDTS